jgi:hypothetical protein
MTTTATQPPKRQHCCVLGMWIASVPAVMIQWKKTRRHGQSPHPVSMGSVRRFFRNRWLWRSMPCV